MKKLYLPLVVLLGSHLSHGGAIGCELLDQDSQSMICEESQGRAINRDKREKIREINLFKRQLEFIYGNTGEKISHGKVLQNFFENKRKRIEDQSNGLGQPSGAPRPGYTYLKGLAHNYYTENEQLLDNELPGLRDKRKQEREAKRKLEIERDDLVEKQKLLNSQKTLYKERILKIKEEQKRFLNLNELYQERDRIQEKLQATRWSRDNKKRRDCEGSQSKVAPCATQYQDLKCQLEKKEREISKYTREQKYYSERISAFENEIKQYENEMNNVDSQLKEILKKIKYYDDEIARFNQLIKARKEKVRENTKAMKAADLAVTIHALVKYLQYLNIESTLANDGVMERLDSFTPWCKSFLQDTFLSWIFLSRDPSPWPVVTTQDSSPTKALNGHREPPLIKTKLDAIVQEWQCEKLIDRYLGARKDKWRKRLNKYIDRQKDNKLYEKLFLPFHSVLLNKETDERLIPLSITTAYLCPSWSSNDEKACEDVFTGSHIEKHVSDISLLGDAAYRRMLMWRYAEHQIGPHYNALVVSLGSAEEKVKAGTQVMPVVKYLTNKHNEMFKSGKDESLSKKKNLEFAINHFNLPKSIYPLLKYLTFANLYYAVTHNPMGHKQDLRTAYLNGNSNVKADEALWEYYPLDLVLLANMKKWEKELKENHRGYLSQTTFCTYFLK